MIRHLIYQISPVNLIANWNLEILLRYKETFNGRRIALVSTQPLRVPTKPSPICLDLFAQIFTEVIYLENDPVNRETPALVKLLETISTEKSDKDFTFFAHTKGVSWVDVKNPITRAVRLWTKTMYERNLEDVDLIETAFEEGYHVLGCFRRKGTFKHFPVGSRWHYSGTFFWFRNSELFSRNWKNTIKVDRYGAEAFPSLAFKSNEAACLYYDNVNFEPYNLTALKRCLGVGT